MSTFQNLTFLIYNFEFSKINPQKGELPIKCSTPSKLAKRSTRITVSEHLDGEGSGGGFRMAFEWIRLYSDWSMDGFTAPGKKHNSPSEAPT